jgi:protein TonB
MKSATNRRLAGALAISVVLHLLAIFPLRLPIDDSADTLQIQVQATLSRTPPVAEPPNKPTPPKKKQAPTPPAKRLTSDRGTGRPVAPEPTAMPEAAEENKTEPAEALVLEQPLLPEYPADALAQGLESCVLASVKVNAAGEVESVEILATDHPGVFDQSVIDAQKSARYAPARQGNQTIPSRVLAVAAFVIQPGKQLDCPLKFASQAEKLIRGNAP